ncbi:PREDICTED: tudor domain-containing protein 5 [Nipponia nippon]|nr:PREDICTED: tudor domain-containing protein 5 [Nipponia nippon]
MSKQAQLMEVLKKEVRSLLMAAKEGLTPMQLEQEYMAMIGKPLPLRDLGFRSTLELVADMPEVVRVCPYEKGTFVLKAIADETTKAIAKLVARQRRSTRARKSAATKTDAVFPSKNPQSFPRRGRAPVLPATVKAELQDLLSSSPLLLLDFDKAFFRRFGRAFQYTQYGFFSMFEVLRSMSDIIAVEQTRAGSLLTLKKYLASEIEKQEEMPRGEAQEEMPQAKEKSEPVETQAVDVGDGLKQPQDLEQSLLDKLIMTPEIPPDAVQDRSLCSLPPLERRCLVGVFVEFIVSPTQFYVHICSRETSDKLQDMMIEMRHCYSNKLVSDRYIMPESSVQPGQLCCVTVSKWWYRVIIHRVIDDQEVEVFYADYGNLGIVRKSWLRFLKWCYLKLPAQAIPCSLAWVKPVEGTWSSAATLLFKKLCGSKLLVGIVDEYVNGILHLFLCDTSTEEDVYFHCVLRDGGCAEVCGENIPSQGFKELNPSALYVQPNEEKMKNKDLPGSLAVGLCSASGLSDQGPSQKLYVPPTTLSAVLAAVRLATSSDYFQWLPSLRKKIVPQAFRGFEGRSGPTGKRARARVAVFTLRAAGHPSPRCRMRLPAPQRELPGKELLYDESMKKGREDVNTESRSPKGAWGLAGWSSGSNASVTERK